VGTADDGVDYSRSATSLDRFRRAVRENEPWSTFGVFLGAAWLTDGILSGLRGAPGTLARASLPVAAGIAAIRALSTNASPREIAISAGAYGAAGLAINLAADALLYRALFAGGAGWLGGGLYSLAKYAGIFLLGSKLESWALERYGERRPSGVLKGESRAFDGVADTIGALGRTGK